MNPEDAVSVPFEELPTEKYLKPPEPRQSQTYNILEELDIAGNELIRLVGLAPKGNGPSPLASGILVLANTPAEGHEGVRDNQVLVSIGELFIDRDVLELETGIIAFQDAKTGNTLLRVTSAAVEAWTPERRHAIFRGELTPGAWHDLQDRLGSWPFAKTSFTEVVRAPAGRPQVSYSVATREFCCAGGCARDAAYLTQVQPLWPSSDGSAVAHRHSGNDAATWLTCKHEVGSVYKLRDPLPSSGSALWLDHAESARFGLAAPGLLEGPGVPMKGVRIRGLDDQHGGWFAVRLELEAVQADPELLKMLTTVGTKAMVGSLSLNNLAHDLTWFVHRPVCTNVQVVAPGIVSLTYQGYFSRHDWFDLQKANRPGHAQLESAAS